MRETHPKQEENTKAIFKVDFMWEKIRLAPWFKATGPPSDSPSHHIWLLICSHWPLAGLLVALQSIKPPVYFLLRLASWGSSQLRPVDGVWQRVVDLFPFLIAKYRISRLSSKPLLKSYTCLKCHRTQISNHMCQEDSRSTQHLPALDDRCLKGAGLEDIHQM